MMMRSRRWLALGANSGTPRADWAVPVPFVVHSIALPVAGQTAQRAAPLHKGLIRIGAAGLMTFDTRGS